MFVLERASPAPPAFARVSGRQIVEETSFGRCSFQSGIRIWLRIDRERPQKSSPATTILKLMIKSGLRSIRSRERVSKSHKDRMRPTDCAAGSGLATNRTQLMSAGHSITPLIRDNTACFRSASPGVAHAKRRKGCSVAKG